MGAYSIPTDKQAQVFLTNQSRVNYKLLSNLASQQSPAMDINDLTLEEIVEYMKVNLTHVRDTTSASGSSIGPPCAASRESQF